MTEITPSTLEPNLVPIEVEDLNIQEGMAIDGTPTANTPATPPADLNIQVSANGSVMSIGNLQSTNFNVGVAGWRLDSNGNIEANDGNFRGDISGASGTFTGSVTTSAIIAIGGSIGNWTISSLALYFDGATDAVSSGMAPADYPFYAGKKYADRATAPFKVEPSGKLTVASIVATGTINAQAGYLSAGVYLDTSNGLVCESGGLNVGVAGHIRGGQTDYNTGTGFFLGYNTDAYKFSVGVSTGNYFTYNGTNVEISGKIKVDSISYLRQTIAPVLESLDGWDVSEVGTGATAVARVGMGYLRPGNAVGNITKISIASDGQNPGITDENDPYFEIALASETDTFGDFAVGCADDGLFDTTSNNGIFGFRFIKDEGATCDGKMYAFYTKSDGPHTVVEYEITGLSLDSRNLYRAEFDYTADVIRFYVNDALRYTSTETLYGLDGEIYFTIVIRNQTDGENPTIMFYNPLVSQEW